MLRLFFISLFIAFSISSFAQKDWPYWTSYEGNFKVQVPSDLSEKIQTITTDIGDLEYHRFFHEAKEEDQHNFIYMVNYVDYPEGSLHSDSTELVRTFFEATKEEAINNVNGELLYADNRKLFDYPGQIWRIDYNEGEATLKTKVFVVKNRFYLIQVASSKHRKMDKKIHQFLESFTLLNSL